MKFGVVCSLPSLEDGSFGDGLSDLLFQLDQADQLGFESFWLTEEGRADERRPPLPVAAAYVAMHSRDISMGLAFSLAESLHPLRLAEEIAALDTMTNGRVQWSAAGEPVGEDGLSKEAELNFREQFTIVSRAVSGEPLAWNGRAYAFPEVGCVPRSVQEHGPPAWVHVETPERVTWAASQGYDVLHDAWSPIAAIQERKERYEEAAIEKDRPSRWQTLRQVYVGESTARAREEVGPGLLRAYRERAPQAPTHSNGGLATQPLDAGAAFADSSERLLDFLFENTVVVGDAIYCRDKVAELRERLGVESLLGCHEWEGLDHASRLLSQKRWIEGVVPTFA